jgi:hypothetical protein
MHLVTAAVAAQAADAVTYAAGMALFTPVELSPLQALGPGPVLLAKAALMAALVATRHRWGWRAAGVAALIVGAVGAAANAYVMWGVLA